MTLFAFQLKSSDNVEFCVDLEIARKSITIRTMLDDLGCDLGLPDEDPGLLKLHSGSENLKKSRQKNS